MIRKEDLQYVLYAKVNRDFDYFEMELLGLQAAEVAERAEEITAKVNIVGFFESADSLSAEQIMELLKLDDTLDACYEALKATECVCPYKIKEVIIAFADYLIYHADKSAEGGHSE